MCSSLFGVYASSVFSIAFDLYVPPFCGSITVCDCNKREKLLLCMLVMARDYFNERTCSLGTCAQRSTVSTVAKNETNIYLSLVTNWVCIRLASKIDIWYLAHRSS